MANKKKRFIIIEQTPIYSFAFRSTSQSINNNAWTKVLFNSLGQSNGLAFDLTTATYTILQEGIYNIDAYVNWPINGNGGRGIRIMINSIEYNRVYMQSAATQASAIGLSRSKYLNVGAVLRVEAIQLSGGALNITPITEGTMFGLTKVSNL